MTPPTLSLLFRDWPSRIGVAALAVLGATWGGNALAALV